MPIELRIRRLLKWGLICPLPFILFAILRPQGREWWRHVSVILGVGYLIPVLGTLAGWRLTELARKKGRLVAFVTQALVGMVLIGSASSFMTLIYSPSLDEARAELSGMVRFEPFAVLIVIGILFALPCRLGRHDKGAA